MMTTLTMILVLIGTGVASANLMKVVELLDTPRPRRRAAARE